MSSEGASEGGQGRDNVVQRKAIVCGDGACGKAGLLSVFTKGFFPREYQSPPFDTYKHDIYVNDQVVELNLYRIAGQEEYDRLRAGFYPGTHVVMICFSVDSPASLENVEEKVGFTVPNFSEDISDGPQWVHQFRGFVPRVETVLVALKCELRNDPRVRAELAKEGLHTVQYEEGLRVATRIRASRYVECSSMYNRGVNEVFHETARISLKAKAKGSFRKR